MRLIGLLFLCVAILATSKGSKILGIFPMPSKSHYILGEALMRGLVERGHEVTMISPFTIDKPMKNYRNVVVNDLIQIKYNLGSKLTNLNTTLLEKLQTMYHIFPTMYHTFHNASNVQEFLKKGEKFDLCIVSFMLAESAFGICNAVQAPAIGFSVVGISSFLTYHNNNPVPYSYVPSPFLSYTDDMSFFERVHSLGSWLVFDAVQHFVSLPYQDKLLHTYFSDVPSMDTIMNDVDLYFINTHTSTDSPKPLLPNLIPIGGFHLQIMDEIPKDIKKFLDDSKRGVIYFSLGSNAKSSELEPQTLDHIIKALGKANFDVLWKFEIDLPNKPKNIHIAKWMPQRSILMHPNVKMFITHGGLGGTVEAIYGGVPMICLPMFGGQYKNCADSESKGYAVTIQLKTITEEKLSKAIETIATNQSYKEKILLRSDLYKNQDINPMDKAVFWAEHVIRHKGAKHLKSRAGNIRWFKYYLLDVLSFAAVILLIVLGLTYFVVKFSLRMCCIVLSKLIELKKYKSMIHKIKVKKHT